MVDGINKNYKPLKLKGTGKQLDLNKLQGLKRTPENSSIFFKYDKNGDGILNEDEVESAASDLKKLGGRDNKASAKDFHFSNKALNQEYFTALEALADQQAKLEAGEAYVEKDSTTGAKTTVTKDGKTEEYDVKATNGERNHVTETISGTTGKVTTKTVQAQDGSVVSFEKFEYDGDTKTTYAYDGTGDDAKLKYIKKSSTGSPDEILGLDSGTYKIDSSYLSEEEYNAGKPSSEIFTQDKQSYSVRYEYNDNGVMATTRANGSDKSSVVYFKENEDGTKTEITEEEYNAQEVSSEENEGTEEETAPATYPVKKGDNLWKIAKAQLGENSTQTEIREYVEEMITLNDDILVDKNDGKGKGWWIYPGQELKLPTAQGEETEEPAEEVEETQTNENEAAEEATPTQTSQQVEQPQSTEQQPPTGQNPPQVGQQPPAPTGTSMERPPKGGSAPPAPKTVTVNGQTIRYVEKDGEFYVAPDPGQQPSEKITDEAVLNAIKNQ